MICLATYLASSVSESDLPYYLLVQRGPKLSEDYSLYRYRGRRVMDVVPLFQVGPTFVGNNFGLNQVSGGGQVTLVELRGGDIFRVWGEKTGWGPTLQYLSGCQLMLTCFDPVGKLTSGKLKFSQGPESPQISTVQFIRSNTVH